VCMRELTYSLHLHIDITVQYRSHTCLPIALTRHLAVTASILIQVLVCLLLQAHAPLIMFWCNNATHLLLLGPAPSCTILLRQHLLYKDVEYIIVWIWYNMRKITNKMHWFNFFFINLLVYNYSNMFRPLNWGHHQGVQSLSVTRLL
jgi:hypothetical protein